MRNPILIFPVGILLVIVIATISVKFDVMTMGQLSEALKTLSVIFVPMAIIGCAFVYTSYKDRKRE